MQLGEQVVVWCITDSVNSIITGTFKGQVDNYTSKVQFHKTKPVEYVFSTAIYPIEYKERLETAVATRQALKKAYDDSISLIYQLRNEIDATR